MPARKSTDAEEGASSPVPRAADAAGKAVLDVTVLERLVEGDAEAIRDILAGFEKPSRRLVEQIHTALLSRSADDVGFGAHSLKSSSRTVGALVLADICLALETAAKAGDWQSITGLGSELSEALEQAVERVNETLTRL
jgi:HPt (histidine-containing phosphotransfer) domain-containing protein